MTATICGHDRETLQWALQHWERCGGLGGFDAVRRGDAYCDAWRAIQDTAKLAAIIAELLRERGLSVKTDPQYDCQWLVFADEYDAVSIVAPRFAKAITMPQARAFALALLDAPNATTQDIERMIGEVTQ